MPTPPAAGTAPQITPSFRPDMLYGYDGTDNTFRPNFKSGNTGAGDIGKDTFAWGFSVIFMWLPSQSTSTRMWLASVGGSSFGRGFDISACSNGAGIAAEFSVFNKANQRIPFSVSTGYDATNTIYAATIVYNDDTGVIEGYINKSRSALATWNKSTLALTYQPIVNEPVALMPATAVVGTSTLHVPGVVFGAAGWAGNTSQSASLAGVSAWLDAFKSTKDISTTAPEWQPGASVGFYRRWSPRGLGPFWPSAGTPWPGPLTNGSIAEGVTGPASVGALQAASWPGSGGTMYDGAVMLTRISPQNVTWLW